MAAAVLKRRGHEVIGVGLRLLDPGDGNVSEAGAEGMRDARAVAENIGIPFRLLDLRKDFREKVIEDFAMSYARGETPNPCVACNSMIKFGSLFVEALRLGAAALATGHYARVERDARTGGYVLKRGIDESKDQSYFLYALARERLSRVRFPLGDMTKEEAREVAGSMGLEVRDKAESQDVCFVGEEGYGALVRALAGEGRPGPILDEKGSVIGEHRGIALYTVGQRRGLGLASDQAMYVIDIDPESNSITVAAGERVLRQSRLFLRDVNYVSIEPVEGEIAVEAVTRYRKRAVPAMLRPLAGERARLDFDEPQEMTAPGQSVVLYRGDEVLCGGKVTRLDSCGSGLFS